MLTTGPSLISTLVALTSVLAAGTASAFTVAENGRAKCVIAVGKDATVPEKNAAKELADSLKQVTGASFRICQESQVKPGDPQILVGQSARAKSILKGTDWQALGRDGIVIHTSGSTLMLSGGRPRGSLYAVYTFLEDSVGCRWWTSTESFIPKKPTLRVSPANTNYTPSLRYREAYYRDVIENPRFDARLKLNGHFEKVPEEYGGHYSIIGWCHTSYDLVPPAKFFKDHPEWYSEINGKRTDKSAQLCLTNEEMRKELTRAALQKIKENPNAGIISITQNDGYGPCECAKCKAVVEEEGSQSGPLIRFVNAVAEEIEKKYPDVLVETLAYVYSRKPPLHVRPRNNVVVRLCTYECSFAQPMVSDVNKPFRDDLEQWSKIAPKLYIWDYVTDFSSYIQPHPNMRVLAPNLRLFAKSNVIGVFEQGDSACSVGDFVRLRAWVLAHLMWNPSMDENKLISEFLNGYYGKAGPYLQQYLDLVHDAIDRDKSFLSCYNKDLSFLTLEDMTRATQLFAAAEKAVAGSPAVAARVRRERLPLDHTWLMRYYVLKNEAKTRNMPFLGPDDAMKGYDDFVSTCKKWDVRNASETQDFDTYLPFLKAKTTPPIPLPDKFKTEEGASVEFGPDRFALYGRPDWVDIVTDPSSPSGKSARMPANHTQWAVQVPIPYDISDVPGEVHCYADIRCDVKSSTGTAFNCGIYDVHDRVVLGGTTPAVTGFADGSYHLVDLGKHKLTGNMFVWVAPVDNAAQVNAIYVDRIVLTREKQ